MSHKFSFFFLTKLQKTKSKLEAKKYVFDQIEMLKNRVGPLKMTVRSSVLWKLLMQLAKKWPETVLKCPNPRVVRFISNQSLVETICFLLATTYYGPNFFIIFSVYLTKQSKNYISITFSTELKPPEDIVLNDRKSTTLSIGWKTPKGPFIYYVITCKGEGGGHSAL